MSNKVYITNHQKAVKIPSGLRILIRRSCNAVLEYEKFEGPAEISVTFVDNAAIQELNAQYRGKDMPTDVLSFPLGENGVYDKNEDTGASLLGVCMVLYLFFSLTTPCYLGYPCLVAYWAFALTRYLRHRSPRYVCGRCGRRINRLGRCPHCGAVNE